MNEGGNKHITAVSATPAVQHSCLEVLSEGLTVQWLPRPRISGRGSRLLSLGYSCRLSIPTRLDAGAEVCRYVLDLCAGRMPQAEQVKLQSALSEAITNAMVHGNLAVSSEHKHNGDWDAFDAQVQSRLGDPNYAGRQVIVEVRLRGDALQISVEDEGEGFELPDPALQDSPEALLAACGRGLRIIQFSVDSVNWNSRRNRIEMTKKLH